MKKKSQGWFPRTRPKQLVMFTNVRAKIGGYKTILPLDETKITRIEEICDVFIGVYNFLEQTRATGQSVSNWAKMIFTGKPVGAASAATPIYQTFTPPTNISIGIFEEFQKLVEDVKGADNYTRGIGEDLMIVAAESANLIESEIVADIKVQPLAGTYKLRIEGSLQGMSALRVEYRKKGTNNWQMVGFLTKLPGDITVAPTTPNEPESGEIRAVLIEKNEEIGQHSPNYPVTIG